MAPKMAGGGMWTCWRQGWRQGHSVAFGDVLRFSITHNPTSEARGLWTVSLNGGELGWAATIEEAHARVEAEARRVVTRVWADWAAFEAAPKIARRGGDP